METLGPDALNDFLGAAFPESRLPMRVTRSDDDGVELVWPVESVQLRPGNTISGPTLMTLADTVAYVAVVARIGLQFLTVTSSLSIDFRRRAQVAQPRPVDDQLVAHSTCTYAIPPSEAPA